MPSCSGVDCDGYDLKRLTIAVASGHVSEGSKPKAGCCADAKAAAAAVAVTPTAAAAAEAESTSSSSSSPACSPSSQDRVSYKIGDLGHVVQVKT